MVNRIFLINILVLQVVTLFLLVLMVGSSGCGGSPEGKEDGSLPAPDTTFTKGTCTSEDIQALNYKQNIPCEGKEHYDVGNLGGPIAAHLMEGGHADVVSLMGTRNNCWVEFSVAVNGSAYQPPVPPTINCGSYGGIIFLERKPVSDGCKECLAAELPGLIFAYWAKEIIEDVKTTGSDQQCYVIKMSKEDELCMANQVECYKQRLSSLKDTCFSNPNATVSSWDIYPERSNQ